VGIVVAPDNDDMGEGDGLPTMGEQAEAELGSMPWACMCGRPMTPGVMHRADAPCYHLEERNEST
jgi:hypothetical protein